jgi:hypothetical protein
MEVLLRYNTIKKWAMGRSNIETRQQPTQLVTVDGKGILAGLRPHETLLFQTLLPDAKSILIPVQYLDDGALAIAKGKQITSKRVATQGLLNQDRQPVDRFSHVRSADG